MGNPSGGGGGLRGIIAHSVSVSSAIATITLTLISLPLSFTLLLGLAVALRSIIHPVHGRYPRAATDLPPPPPPPPFHTRSHHDIAWAAILSSYLILVFALRVVSARAAVHRIASAFHSACIKGPSEPAWPDDNATYAALHRLLLTYLWSFTLVFFALGLLLAALLLVHLAPPLGPLPGLIASSVLLLLFALLLFHSTCVLALATIVSALDPSTFGLPAIYASGSFLLKGRLPIAYSLHALYLLSALGVAIAFGFAVLNVVSLGIRVLLVFAFAPLLAFVDQLGMVAFTILYFDCKAYHDDLRAHVQRLAAFGSALPAHDALSVAGAPPSSGEGDETSSTFKPQVPQIMFE